MVEVGHIVPFLHKSNGQELAIDAQIIGVKGARIEIEYRHPAGYRYRRTLRTPQERTRLLSAEEAEFRRGAPAGNQNAAKDGPKRIAVTLSFSNQHSTRLEKLIAHLKRQGKAVDVETVRKLVYAAVDAYLDPDGGETATENSR